MENFALEKVNMDFWITSGVLLLALILSVIFIFVEFRRSGSGIIVSSHWLHIMDVGIVTVIISMGGMITLFFLQVSFYIGTILLLVGTIYIVRSLLYRKEWTKLVRSHIQSKI